MVSCEKGEKGRKGMKGVKSVGEELNIEYRISNKKNAWGKTPPCRTNKRGPQARPTRLGEIKLAIM